MASIRDVARTAGVSPATVSRTFTAPNLISQQTQQRVLEVAKQLNYRPPRQRASRSKDTREERQATAVIARRAIGFQFFTSTTGALDTIATNLFYAPVFAGAQAEAALFGLHLLVHTTNRHALLRELPRMVLDQAIGGMLLVGTPDSEIVDTFASHVPNIVLVDSRDGSGRYECVLSDGFSGAYVATRYLMDLRHRRIGFYLSEAGIPTFQDRMRGYLSCLFEAGIPPSTELVIGAALSHAEGRSLLAEELRSSRRPTALVAANDEAALFVMQVCREIGIRVPEDLSLIGFDDVSLGRHSDPQLTTVNVDKELMGRLAVRRLHARIHQEAVLDTHAVQHQVPVTLVIRESCRPV